MLASRLGLAGAVADGLGYVFERWDGSGVPDGVGGEALPLAVRVMSLANELEVHHRLGPPGWSCPQSSPWAAAGWLRLISSGRGTSQRSPP